MSIAEKKIFLRLWYIEIQGIGIQIKHERRVFFSFRIWFKFFRCSRPTRSTSKDVLEGVQ